MKWSLTFIWHKNSVSIYPMIIQVLWGEVRKHIGFVSTPYLSSCCDNIIRKRLWLCFPVSNWDPTQENEYTPSTTRLLLISYLRLGDLRLPNLYVHGNILKLVILGQCNANKLYFSLKTTTYLREGRIIQLCWY